MLDKLFIISVFFPFLSPYPIDQDIQPISGLLGILVVIRYILGNNFKIPVSFVIMISISVLSLAYINPFIDNAFNFSKSVSLSYGLIVLLAFKASSKSLTNGLFSWIIIVYFSYSLLLLFNFDFFQEVQGYFIRANNSNILGYRGIATFSTEPGLFGGLLVFFLIINDYLFRQQGNVASHRVNFILVFIMILLTKSGTGYAYFALYLFLKLAMSKKFSSFLILLTLISATIAASLLIDDKQFFGRGVHLILLSIMDFELLVSQDTSIYGRLLDASISFISMLEYPLGLGLGGVNEVLKSLTEEYSYLSNYYGKSVVIGLVSSLSYFVAMYGVFFYVFLAYLFGFYSKANYIESIFSIIFMLFSYSMAFPPIWILNQLVNVDKKQEYENR
jgi:hypothetical protein